MKSARGRILAALIITEAILGGLLTSTATAKSFRITGLDIDAQLHPDGSMDVSESRTYQFRGSFSFAYRDLPLSGRVIFRDFEVLENGRTGLLFTPKSADAISDALLRLARTPELSRKIGAAARR